MAQRNSSSAVPPPSADQRRVAAENFERARQVLLTGNHDYAINLLTLCCQIDPANVLYRQSLRRAQKEKYGNNLRGSRFAFLTTPRTKARVKAAKSGRDYLRVLELGEAVLTKNPWDVGTQMDMAEAFDALGLVDLAVFTLDQARQKSPKDATLNRALARLFEKRGDFQKAIALWQMVQEADPKDVEAAHKAMHLAASETIARGKYEEVASGTKTSPALGGIEAQAVSKQDKLAKEAGPLEKRIEANPTEPSLYLQLADVFLKHGQDDRARAALQQGLGPTGNHFTLQLKLMELEVQPFRKNLELTDAKLKKLREKVAAGQDVDDDPSEDDLVKARARLAKEVANRELDILRTRADRFPADTGHRLDLGIRLLKADKLDEAITELQQAKRDDKTKARAAMYAGVAFRRRNNWKLAQRNFEEALQLLPASDEAARKETLYQLATGSADAGDLARAVDLGHELANLDFGYKGIGDLLDGWEKKVQEA
jgi:tetratricopeptide (TPR) repeat protein